MEGEKLNMAYIEIICVLLGAAITILTDIAYRNFNEL